MAAEITPAELIEALEGRGYSGITEGQLEEWRRYDLLPPLRDHGRGQGAGKVYVWDDPDIVERTIDVHKLVKVSRSTDSALVSIWAKGYSVPTEVVRDAWLRRLASQKQRLEKGTADGQELDDIIGKKAAKLERDTSRDTGVPGYQIRVLSEELIKLRVFRELSGRF